MRFIFVTIALLFACSPGHARPHRTAASAPVGSGWCLADPVNPCGGTWAAPAAATPQRGVRRPSRGVSEAHLVAHPAGCPSRAFCGCGASVRVFGHSVRELWLAANWLRFPRAAPAPGMVAARRGHVFVLESHVAGDTWIVYDANSGRGGTRVHARSLTGYTVVNPRA